MKKVIVSSVIGLMLLSSLSYASEWRILDISMGISKSELKKKGFKCRKNSSYCEAYYSSKYMKKKKDLSEVINSIKVYINHEEKAYKIQLHSSVSFEKIEREAYQNVFSNIVNKEEGIDIKIEEGTVSRGMPVIFLTAVDTTRETKYREYLEKKALDILNKYSKK